MIKYQAKHIGTYYVGLPDLAMFRDEIDEAIGLITEGELEMAKEMLKEISDKFTEYILK